MSVYPDTQHTHTHTHVRTPHTHTHTHTQHTQPHDYNSFLMGAGFTLLAAAGPFSTSDSLDMAPLNDLIARVRGEEPDVLLLVSGGFDL